MSESLTFSTEQITIQYLEAILDTLREPLLVLDENFRIITCNQAFLNTFNSSREQTLNQLFFELENQQWDHPDLHQLLVLLRDKRTSFQDFELQLKFTNIDSRIFIVNGQTLVVPDSDQKLLLLGIQDITERKITELKLEAYTKQLEKSNQELQDFASITSHDLQEPLRKIQAFSDLLRIELGHDLSESVEKYMDRIQNAAKRMQILINDLLAYSRVTTRANPFVPVNMIDIINDVLSDLEIHIRDTQAQITVNGSLQLNADPLQMRMLIQNLISNGLKFHLPNLPPRIEINMYDIAPEKVTKIQLDQLPIPMCEITVKDYGIGFSEKYLSKIFLIFQRLHYRNEYEGTGVGLAICRKIVDRHGGMITAHSQPNQGATFVVTLPLDPQILE